MSPAKLKRSLGLPLVALYGLGNILGAGIYVLVGEVAGLAGSSAALAFLIAMVTAAFTAFSYMELSSRFPVSASISVYVHKAFGKQGLSVAIGLAMVAGGIASSAALSQGFAGYFGTFFAIPTVLASVGILLLIGLIAIKGIGESAKAAAVLTVLEVIGLLLVIWFGRGAFGQMEISELASLDPAVGVGGLIAGAFLAFYAFIGFEDMVNVSEEVKNPRRTMPLAILFALGTATLLYLLVVIVAITVVPPNELADSKAPLTLVLTKIGVANAGVISLIGMVAAMNGVIVQVIMGSRILYGLSKQGWLRGGFDAIHPRFQTPLRATVVVVGAMILGTILLPLVSLAQLTSLLVLSIFLLVNISLIVIKQRHPATEDIVAVPRAIPYIGTLLCACTIGYQLFSWIS